MSERREVVHQCPPKGKAVTPCCGKTPFELPRTDRMTLKKSLVTCGKPDRTAEEG